MGQRVLSSSGIRSQKIVQRKELFNGGCQVRFTACRFVAVRVYVLTITFYKTDHGRPGKVLGAPQTVTCTDTAGNFACTIKTVHLSGGANGKRYWLSVVANCDSACGEWGWIQNTATHRDPGQWENPGGGLGFGCTSWNDTSSCITLSGVVDDFAFDLRGNSN